MIDFSKWEEMIDYTALHKKNWAKNLIKYVAYLDRKSGNRDARNSLIDINRFPGQYGGFAPTGATKVPKKTFVLNAYFQDVRHRFIDMFSTILRRQLHENANVQQMYFDDYEEYHDFWWCWENLDTIFQNIFMKKIMEHIDHAVKNEDYIKLL